MTIVSAAEKLLTTAELARELGVTARTVLRYVERGYLRPTRVLPSGHRRWSVEDVRRQLAERPPLEGD